MTIDSGRDPVIAALARRLSEAATQASARGHAVISARDRQRVHRANATSAMIADDETPTPPALSPGRLEWLMSTLGPLMFTPGELPHPDHQYVFVVSNVGRRETPRSLFHSDTSYVEHPPSYTLLAGVTIPDSGGETVFVDQYEAFESMNTALQAELRGVEFLHGASRVPDASAAGDGAWHPVLRRHPVTERTALFVSARERLLGARRNGRMLAAGQAKALIDEVHGHATTGGSVYRHRWQEGDLLLTDNRCTLHAADHSAVVGDRVLHRVMVRGERPAPPDQDD